MKGEVIIKRINGQLFFLEKSTQYTIGLSGISNKDELMTMLYKFILFIETRQPHMKGLITADETKLKQTWYNYKYHNSNPVRVQPAHNCALILEKTVKDEFIRGGSPFDGEEKIPAVPKEQIPTRITAIEAWKGLSFNNQEQLTSRNTVWIPRTPIEATCEVTGKMCTLPPCIRCQCGIYAGREREHAYQNDYYILTKVKMWGRYILGKKGIRAQYAQITEIHLQREQAKDVDIINMCKVYGVPIYGEVVKIEYQQLYNPETEER